MSDNATSLGFRLRVIASVIGKDCPELKLQDIYYTCRDAAARIAELEAAEDQRVMTARAITNITRDLDAANARIAELEAKQEVFRTVNFAYRSRIAELEQSLGETTARIETDTKLMERR